MFIELDNLSEANFFWLDEVNNRIFIIRNQFEITQGIILQFRDEI